MKANLTCVLTLTLLATATSQAIAGANCAQSQSWQCTHHSSSTGTTDPGAVIPDHQTLDPGTGTTNGHLGTALPDHHNVALVPTPVPVLTPTLIPIQAPLLQPTATPQRVPQPMNVPAQVPQLVPPLQPIATPQKVPQPMNVPGQVPQLVPPLQPIATPQKVPQPMNVPGQVQQPATGTQHPVTQLTGSSQRPHPTPGQQHTGHMLVTHQPLPAVPGALAGTAEGQYGLEMIEPGIENHRVEVYRSEDVREATYHDNIPVDAGGFNLTVIGTRNPDYMH